MSRGSACSDAALCLLLAGPQARAQEGREEIDNGTDPTRFSTTAAVVYEYNDLISGLSRHAPRFELIPPFGAERDYSVRLTVPVVGNDVAGNDGLGLGDAGLRLAHVFGVGQKGGMVVQGEMIFDTASRPELGTGRHVFKGTFIYARFLPQGIFAPASVHSVDVGGDSDRAGVNSTTIGKAFGGNSQLFIKPTIFACGDRPGDWSIEIGYKVVGF